MRLPAWLFALLMLGWGVYSTYYYYCVKCGCCSAEAPVSALPPTTQPVPLLSNWDKPEVTPGALFDAYKATLLMRGGLADTLLINGLYRKGEVDGPKLGLARANAVKVLLAGSLPDNRIRTAALLVADSMSTTKPGVAANFEWLKGVIKNTESTIIEAGNSTTILFPFNSTSRDRDAKVEAYLQNLCKVHRTNAATFTIVGHTDDVGEEQENVILGLGRAKAISAVLARCGIARDRLFVDSKGESIPIADNTTEAGRHQNRRVVITVTP
jgi:outer membrane protein OmpA-like peptidoglycan-associated protein